MNQRINSKHAAEYNYTDSDRCVDWKRFRRNDYDRLNRFSHYYSVAVAVDIKLPTAAFIRYPLASLGVHWSKPLPSRNSCCQEVRAYGDPVPYPESYL